jgi:20S proteasome subunit alpha 7
MHAYPRHLQPQILADRLGHYCQAYTCYSSVRPFGASAIVGCVDKTGPAVYMIEPSGVYWGYRGCATGKGRQLAKTEVEKLDLDNMTCEEAVKHVALIIHKVHDDAKDKDFELEMSWICPQSNNRHQSVPKEVLQQAEQWAKEQLTEEMED